MWIDYRPRVFGLGIPMRPTGEMDADIAALRRLFRKEMARYPMKFTEAVVAESPGPRPAGT